MNTELTSQICTNREQSERLLTMGLKKETADMHHYQYVCGGRWETAARPSIVGYNNRVVPAWSLNRLMELMPNLITHDNYQLILGVNAKCVYYADDEYGETFKDFEGNLYECVVKCIEWLIKEGYFNKDYLE